MKVFDRIILVIFSIIMFVISVISLLLLFNVMDVSTVTYGINAVKNGDTLYKVAIVVFVVIILLAIKALLTKKEGEEGIIVENTNGKLLITKESLENLVNSTVKEYDYTDNVSSKIILDKDKNLRVFVFLSLRKNVIIKDLSVNIQEDVKKCLKETMDLETKEVSIKIKSISKSKSEATKKAVSVKNDEEVKVEIVPDKKDEPKEN